MFSKNLQPFQENRGGKIFACKPTIVRLTSHLCIKKAHVSNGVKIKCKGGENPILLLAFFPTYPPENFLLLFSDGGTGGVVFEIKEEVR